MYIECHQGKKSSFRLMEQWPPDGPEGLDGRAWLSGSPTGRRWLTCVNAATTSAT
jgi:hypothetical protein